MAKPIVAIVGRPNVGKSTLVNRIAEKRDAIVHESRGVTRDRSYHDADWNGREFKLIDTGGIESIKSQDRFAPHIREQALLACEEADVIVFVVDGTTGVTDEDEEVARIVRKSTKPVFLVVNKMVTVLVICWMTSSTLSLRLMKSQKMTAFSTLLSLVVQTWANLRWQTAWLTRSAPLFLMLRVQRAMLLTP